MFPDIYLGGAVDQKPAKFAILKDKLEKTTMHELLSLLTEHHFCRLSSLSVPLYLSAQEHQAPLLFPLLASAFPSVLAGPLLSALPLLPDLTGHSAAPW